MTAAKAGGGNAQGLRTRRLTLVRHAEAGRPDAVEDRDRPLTARGGREAEEIARRLAGRGLVADRLLASPALRTATTARLFARTFGADERSIRYDDSLYLASAGDLLAAIHATPASVRHLMLFGHNPGISDLARLLHASLPWFELPPAGCCALQARGGGWAAFGTGPIEPLACERP